MGLRLFVSERVCGVFVCVPVHVVVEVRVYAFVFGRILRVIQCNFASTKTRPNQEFAICCAVTRGLFFCILFTAW